MQGLRAVAVGIVVAFHLRPDLVQGGFIGVDVFFVISGYLITGHLYREYRETGRLRLADFWARRVRRLLPASFLVLLFCFGATIAWVPRALWSGTLQQIAASASYIQNLVLATNSVDYLAASNQPTLVQHYWSLSTEEQFYVAWPLLLLGGLAIIKRRAAVPMVLGGIFAASLAVSILWTMTSAASAYFVTFTRAWEFAAGGLMVFVPALGVRTRLVLSWTGPALIVLGCCLITPATPFPGVAALLPVVGTATTILSGGRLESRWSATRLSLPRPVQYLGGISYAVYLWHWPLIVLAPFVTGQAIHAKASITIVVLSIGLAALTKRFIEDPIRKSRGLLRGRARPFAFMSVGILVVAGSAIGVSGILQLQIQHQRAAIAAAIHDGAGCFGAAAMVPAHDCRNSHAVTPTVDPAQAAADIFWLPGAFSVKDHAQCVNHRCVHGLVKQPTHTIALVGDSHAEQLINPLLIAAKKHQWRVISYTKSGCSELVSTNPETPTRSIAGLDQDSCAAIGLTTLRSLLSDASVDTVLFANYTSESPFTASQASWEVSQLQRAGKRVALVRDFPGPGKGVNAPQCVEQHRHQYDPCSTTLPAEDAMQQVARQTQVPLVDLTGTVCDANRCHVVVGGSIVYFDTDHLTGTFAATLAPFLERAVDNLITGSPAGYRIVT